MKCLFLTESVEELSFPTASGKRWGCPFISCPMRRKPNILIICVSFATFVVDPFEVVAFVVFVILMARLFRFIIEGRIRPLQSSSNDPASGALTRPHC